MPVDNRAQSAACQMAQQVADLLFGQNLDLG
jgi:hypothetical protein